MVNGATVERRLVEARIVRQEGFAQVADQIFDGHDRVESELRFGADLRVDGADRVSHDLVVLGSHDSSSSPSAGIGSPLSAARIMSAYTSVSSWRSSIFARSITSQIAS